MTKRPRSPALTLAALVLPLLLFVSAAGALPGDLDAGFDGDGKVVTDSGMLEGSTDVVVQPDGKIVAVGGGDVFNLARYNTDGSLDTTFDGDGKASLSVPAGVVQLFAVALQADGKLVVAGQDGVLARFNADGSIDTSFSGDGIVEAPGVTYFPDVEIASDGKIVALGSTVIARYNSNGTLDTSFDGDGMAASVVDLPNDARLQADGKIVVVGTEFVDAFSTAFVAARYTTSGALDSAFSDDGIVVTDTSAASEGLQAVAVQSDGKIVAAGSSGGVFAFVRYTGAGALDATFDGDGIRLETLEGIALDVEIDGDGKIVAGGCTGVVPVCNDDFALLRLSADGATETSVTTDFGARDQAWGVALQADGKIVLAGETRNPDAGTGDFALARYVGGGATPPPGSADLSLTKADSPDSVGVGETVTYTLTVLNAGPAAAADATVTDPLPAGVTLLSATASQGSCSGTGTVICNLGPVASGAGATVTIAVRATAAGTVSNTATVSSSTADPSPGNNSATATTTVGAGEDPPQPPGEDPPPALPDLSVSKSAHPSPAVLNELLTYTITARNLGGPAAGASVTDDLPAGAEFVSVASSQGLCAGPTTTFPHAFCSLGPLASGASATITVVVRPTEESELSNVVSIAPNDQNPANQRFELRTSVLPAANCQIVGTEGDDILYGTTGADVICGLGGDDRIFGNARQNIQDRGDVLYGGPGNDQLSGWTGNDLVRGGDGNDTYLDGPGNDTFFGGAGDDVAGGSGSAGDDRFYGGAGRDRLDGRAGADTVNGGDGHDNLEGGSGNDRIWGGPGHDLISGERGADYLVGGRDPDSVFGGDGNDILWLRDGDNDRGHGRGGRDRCQRDGRPLDRGIGGIEDFF
jgi:uncharacterized delta-60 repeat protein/uncharacterized repeat protein (TIGR01451 family)